MNAPYTPTTAIRLLSTILRFGRITKYSPSWRGVNALMKIYQSTIPPGLVMRAKDIDGDLKFDIEVRETMGLYLWHFPDLYEIEERNMFCSLITHGCTVLDVGANCGLYTLLAAKRGARVFSIEADPRNAAILRHHIELNGFQDRVTVFEMAATETAKPVPLYRHPFNTGESNIVSEGLPCGMIEGRTLDSLKLPPIDICKMDIEKSELMALQGFRETLARSPKIKLLIEHSEHPGSGKLLDCLRSNFSSVEVIEKTLQVHPKQIPAFCNLICSNC